MPKNGNDGREVVLLQTEHGQASLVQPRITLGPRTRANSRHEASKRTIQSLQTIYQQMTYSIMGGSARPKETAMRILVVICFNGMCDAFVDRGASGYVPAPVRVIGITSHTTVVEKGA